MIKLPRFFPKPLPPLPTIIKPPENISYFSVVSANPVPDSKPGRRVLYKDFRNFTRAVEELQKVKDHAEATVLRAYPRKGNPYNIAGYITGQEVPVKEADTIVRKWLYLQEVELLVSKLE